MDGGAPLFCIEWGFDLTIIFYTFLAAFLILDLFSEVQKIKDLPV